MAMQKASNKKYPDLTLDKEGSWKDPFCFIQAADTQYGLIANWNGAAEEKITWNEEVALTKQAISLANNMNPKPRFFIVCGDLVDAFPGTLHYEAQIRDLKQTFQLLDPNIPMVCVCGNHDVGNSPTKESLKSYRDRFGDDYFTFWVGGVFFIVINSQYYADSTNVPDEFESHEKWIDEQLQVFRDSNSSQAVVFQHIPWFLKSFDEDDEYFNMKKEIRARMLKKFRNAGIKHIFSGHYHRNAGGMWNDLEMIVTSAIGCQIGSDKSGMRIVRVFEKTLDHKYYGLEEFPLEISLDPDKPLP